MRNRRLLQPDQVTESVRVTPVPSYEERSCVSYIDFVTMKRFNEEVNLAPCLTPVTFRDTVICYKDSTRKRFKSQTSYEPRVKPRKFSDTLVVFPKRPQKSYVTCVDYHIGECRKWFKTTMEFKARTYTTSKMVKPDSDEESDSLSDLSDTDEGVGPSAAPCGPGASQVFIPRWNKDVLLDIQQYPHLVNGDFLINGY